MTSLRSTSTASRTPRRPRSHSRWRRPSATGCSRLARRSALRRSAQASSGAPASCRGRSVRMSRPDGCAVVTGGTRGIGAAIAGRLEADGWDVVRLGRADADIADRDAVAAAFERVRADRGPIIALINNAGIRADGLAISMDHDDWSSVVDTNLTGAFNCTKAALPDMRKARFGRIVNVSSVGAERANPGQANYVAAKAGLLGL